MSVNDINKMQKENSGYEKFQFAARAVFDILAVIFAWFISYYIKFHLIEGGAELPFYQFVILCDVAVLSTFTILYANGLYSPDISGRTELTLLLVSSFDEFLFVIFFYYYIIDERISREHLLMYFVLLFVLLVLGRRITYSVIRKRAKKGFFTQNVLFVGGGERIDEFYNSLKADNGSMFNVSGQYLGEFSAIDGVAQISEPDLEKAVEKTKADLVVVSFPLEMQKTEQEVSRQALELFSQNVYIIPHVQKSYAGTVIREFRSIPILKLNGAGPNVVGRFIKRIFDIVSCTIGVVLLSPVYIVLAILVKLSSPGPVFFKQKRVTKDGRVFEMYKFRSMRTDMPEGKAHWTEENDPRITRIGRILRKTSLDEIPQFFNVIGGSMSLIGPRPERPELEEGFKKTIPGYNMRHRMKAGISGWAQVNGLRGNTSLEKRIDYDLYYVRNWSFLFDLKIVLLTFFKGFINKNAY